MFSIEPHLTNPITFVRQPYVITIARHKLGVHEMRVMLRIIEALQKHMEYGKERLEVQKNLLGDLEISLPTSGLIPTNSENYSCVKKALRSLRERTITIVGHDEQGAYEVTTALITRSLYYLNNRIVKIQIDREILPSYLALAKNYSQYSLEVAFNSSSVYTMKLYQYISHWKDKRQKTFLLSEIRELLQLEEKYTRPKDLKKRILDPISKELKTRADVWFDIKEAIKEGNRTTGYLFKIYQKEISPKDQHLAEIHADNITKILQELFKFRSRHIIELEPILKKRELQGHIYDKIQEIGAYLRTSHVKNTAAYTLTALKNEFKAHLT